jgi:activator of HSP90 ATPase
MEGGVGSIWNANNWHWEEKNYTEFAKKYITDALTQKVRKECGPSDKPADTLIRFYEIKEIKGSASVTIRKQKQIFFYEFELTVYFDGVGNKGGANDGQEAKGTVKI